jgi:GT2 family glycosyltransferase
MAHMRRCFDDKVMDCVVVDNASKDSTPELLQRYQDWATIVLSDQNNGFGRGCNIGLNKVTTEYTLFLNPDAVLDSDAVEKMLAFMDANPQVGVCGPATKVGPSQEEFEWQVAGRREMPADLVRAALPLMAATDLYVPIVPGNAPFKTGWVCGAAMLMRTEHVKSLGGFDPRFFLYWEEVDLCKRIEDSGYGVWALPEAVAWHIGGVSSSQDASRINGCISSHFFQSRRYYMVKHHGWIAATLAELGELGLVSTRTLIDLIRGRGTDRIKPRMQARLFSTPSI